MLAGTSKLPQDTKVGVLILKLQERGFKGRIKAVTAFTNSAEAFEKLRDLGYSMEEYIYPMECFTRRDRALAGKKNVPFEQALETMVTAKKYHNRVRAFLLNRAI